VRASARTVAGVTVSAEHMSIAPGHTAERYDKDGHALMMSMNADRATEKRVRGVEQEMMQRFRHRDGWEGRPRPG
jgi:hypothetical protein